MPGFNATMLADSRAAHKGRLTSMELEFPMVIAKELLTHGALSKSGLSSRAKPVSKVLDEVRANPFIPEFRVKKSGMQAGGLLDVDDAEFARRAWLRARDFAVDTAGVLMDLDVHKQYVNRLLEPFAWTKYIVTGTNWSNFFHLRVDQAAEPSFQKIAAMAMVEFLKSTPRELDSDEWHIPFIDPDTQNGIDEYVASAFRNKGFARSRSDHREVELQVSVARCARVSYDNHNGTRDIEKDIALFRDLRDKGHWSAFAHQGRPADDPHLRSGNFLGFHQYRQQFPNQNVEHIDRATAQLSLILPDVDLSFLNEEPS